MVTAYVELPVPDDIPSALEGCRLYTHAPDLDLRAPKASSSKPSSAKSTEGSSSKSPGGFQFGKALKGACVGTLLAARARCLHGAQGLAGTHTGFRTCPLALRHQGRAR